MGTSLAHESGQIGIALVLDRNFSGMWLFGHSNIEFRLPCGSMRAIRLALWRAFARHGWLHMSAHGT
jgi:hypothetical protein